MSNERGMTMVEMLVAMSVGLVVTFATLAIVDVSARNSAQVTHRVDLNQRARPVMQHLLDELHSACVSPGVAPVLEGSTDSSLSFMHQIGSVVTPVPDKRVVSLTGDTLTESVYPPATGSEPGAWTFQGSPTSTRTLLTDIAPARVGEPEATVPLFRYYGYPTGQTTLSELPVPLSAENAAKAVRVDVAFAIDPETNPAQDENDGVTVADSVLLRFEPAQGGTTEGNRPCV
jgi:prepilin-type N-terminal cleavage/methylation domain-containing protein